MAKTTKKIAKKTTVIDDVARKDWAYRADYIEEEIKRVEGNAKADFKYEQERVTRIYDQMMELKVRVHKLERTLNLGKAFLLYGAGSAIFFCAMVGLQTLITN